MRVAIAARPMETAGRGDFPSRRKGVADRHGARRGSEKPKTLEQEDERDQARKPRPPQCVTPALSEFARQSPSPVENTLTSRPSGVHCAATNFWRISAIGVLGRDNGHDAAGAMLMLFIGPSSPWRKNRFPHLASLP